MRAALCVALALVACGKKQDKGAAPAEGSAVATATRGSATGGSGAGAETPPAGPGVTIKSSINPEFAGTYDKAFARLSNGQEPVTIAFVRGCPSVVCTDNPFELETMAAKCPKAFLAVATLKEIDKDAAADKGVVYKDPKPGHLASDLVTTGPGENPSTITLAAVTLEVTDVGPDGVAGSAVQSTTESKVAGAFKAEICGRM